MDRAGQVQLDPRDLKCAVTSESSVLISGGSSDIRVTLAKMIHMNRASRNGRFVSLDSAAAAVPWVSGDTLFIEEINELSTSAGEQLAQLVDRGRSSTSAPAPRIIAATGYLLDRTSLPVSIPEELFYRLNIIHIVLPPLVGQGDLASIFGRREM